MAETYQYDDDDDVPGKMGLLKLIIPVLIIIAVAWWLALSIAERTTGPTPASGRSAAVHHVVRTLRISTNNFAGNVGMRAVLVQAPQGAASADAITTGAAGAPSTHS